MKIIITIALIFLSFENAFTQPLKVESRYYNECTLSREFNKYGLSSPKKILMYLKVHHAIKLMHNTGFNVREISSLSGFTDEKRMAECFHRMFNMPPGEYRATHIDNKILTQFV